MRRTTGNGWRYAIALSLKSEGTPQLILLRETFHRGKARTLTYCETLQNTNVTYEKPYTGYSCCGMGIFCPSMPHRRTSHAVSPEKMLNSATQDRPPLLRYEPPYCAARAAAAEQLSVVTSCKRVPTLSLPLQWPPQLLS